MAIADVVLASHRSGDKLRTAARTLVVAVRPASCLWVLWPRRAAGHLGDVTANEAMRGGGGVDGAIHRSGGPAVLRDCIARLPKGLATGDAGWTTAGDLPTQWVIRTVGPNYQAGQRDRSLLVSCYRRALEVADDLGACSVAFPLISTGVFG